VIPEEFIQFSSNHSGKATAKHFNISTARVARLRKQYGLSKNWLTKEDGKLMLALRESGMKVHEIAKKFECSPNTVTLHIQRAQKYGKRL